MADNEIKKKNFRTIETDQAELNKKIRAHRLKILKRILIIIGILLIGTAGVMLMMRLRQYTDYDVTTSVERSDTVATKFIAFKGGIIKYSNDGATYTNDAGELLWNQTYEMQEPLIDICEGYVVFAEKGGTHVYVLNQSGLQGNFETTMKIDKIKVANQGTVAALMDDGGASNIKLYDKSGKNLAGGQIHMEKSGYPLDIALSHDAIKLAVTMMDVKDGAIQSVVAFYNFGSVGQNEIDHMVGSYSYPGVVIPDIEFVSNNRMVAFGNSKIVIFEGTQKPKVSKEIAVDKEIKSVFYNSDYFGLVTNNEDKDNTRHMEIYDTKGSHVLSKDFALDYNTIEFLANDEICIRSNTQCLIYNTYGVKHFTHTFDVPIYQILSGATSRSYTFILEGTTEKVKLK